MNIADYEKQDKGKLFQFQLDILIIAQFIGAQIINFFISAITGLISVFIITIFSFRLLLILSFFSVLYIILLIIFYYFSSQQKEFLMQESISNNNLLLENINSYPDQVYRNLQPFIFQRFYEKNQKTIHRKLKVSLLSVLEENISKLFGVFLNFILLSTFIILISEHNLNIGEVIFLTSINAYFFNFLFEISKLIINKKELKMIIKRFNQFLDIDNQFNKHETLLISSKINQVEIKALTFTYCQAKIFSDLNVIIKN
jgi:ATP-binding cassette subfamily B protein RaxB